MADARGVGGGGMKKELTLFNFFTIGFGAIVGTGWVLLVGDWMILGGGPIPAMIAFAIGAVLLVPIGMCFGELASAIPLAGGIVEYAERAFGRKAGFITGWMLLLGNAVPPTWEALAITTLISNHWAKLPGLSWLTSVKLYTIMGSDVYLWPTVISLALVGLVAFLNFRGAGSMAKLSSFLAKALIVGVGLAFVVSLVMGSPSNALPVFSQVFDTNGNVSSTTATTIAAGVASVLVMTPFLYVGFDTIPQQAEEASENLDWKRFGLIPSIALLASGAFYLLCIYSFGTIIDWHEFAQASVPALAVLKRVNVFVYLAMLVVATMAPLGPMNSFYAASARLLLAMGRERMVPEKFAWLSPKRGTPTVANVLMTVLAASGAFLGSSLLVPLTNVASLGFIFACMMASLSCLRLRRTEPDLPRPYRVNGGRPVMWLATAAGLAVIALMVVPASPAALGTAEWIITGAWVVVGAVIILTVGRKPFAPETPDN